MGDRTVRGDVSVPAGRLVADSVPTVLVDGATTPWPAPWARAVTAAVPGVVRHATAGKPHLDPPATSPVLVEWLSTLRPG